MGLDIVFNTLNKMFDLRFERMVGHVAAVGGDGGEGPVVMRARVFLRRVDFVVLNAAVGAKEPTIEAIGITPLSGGG
jgi:hypothetical protein